MNDDVIDTLEYFKLHFVKDKKAIEHFDKAIEIIEEDSNRKKSIPDAVKNLKYSGEITEYEDDVSTVISSISNGVLISKPRYITPEEANNTKEYVCAICQCNKCLNYGHLFRRKDYINNCITFICSECNLLCNVYFKKNI